MALEVIIATQAQLQDKRVVILGGTSGIGLATAQAAARDAPRRRLEPAGKRGPRPGGPAPGSEGYAADLSREDAIKDFFANIGAFDHLVYTAGENLKLAALADTSLESARQFWNIRYLGAFAAVKYASPNTISPKPISTCSLRASAPDR